MKALFSRACALAFVASLAACASNPASRGVEVTRFHLGQHPIARGQIVVEPINPAAAGSIEFRTHAASVARELARLGWTVVGTVGQSRSEEHTSELQSLMRISYAVFCLKKKK